ncbi:hypothetical protein JX265_002457 [Neoarthrinium moseri]|uniref:Uncharacterized protein n=1 Tax=Neoarthrinium moseri TaxID=1658444 RepID=A0A9P9WUV1_9PEZI|nr:uncharacterized protein JN550_000271 [Neoarthrinium moseri]KAI1854818.1 hypothetical protein JX266_000936 [Neoarthrinium moseri]KAI1878089.1 hypothetical protein JN550_000271 [Neoarthrinium moseri]KAI1879503.1 hypothetical protein JX265_002457 [Neoarthrinium moseri]
MDDYMFRSYVNSCKYVPEATSYLEIFNYTDPEYNTDEEHPLTPDEFENFLYRRGAFEPPKLREGVKIRDGLRLVLQKNAKQPETFTPNYITLTPTEYEVMVRSMRLPFRAIESTSVVGPFFWAAFDQDAHDPHLQIIFRKSDVRKKGKTRGWEIMLSHSFNTGITTGYVKGTPSSDIEESIHHLRACANQIAHPMLLPVIILSHDLSAKTDQKQRDARAWLRRLENAVTMRNEIEERETYMDFDLDAINRDLVECHSQVLWKRPQAYQEIIKEMKEAMVKFHQTSRPELHRGELEALHGSMESRLDFYRIKLLGVENYAHTTLERLNIQRQALYNIIAQKESKLNLEMAAQQRRLAHASKRDSTAMKTLSLLGAVFLPGTFLASLFSMTFFDFNVGPSDGSGDSSGAGAQVSEYLWVYFVVTIPLTLVIVGSWWWMDKRRQREYAAEDVEIEKGIDRMESEIMAIMRKKTMNKATTWNSGNPPSISLLKKDKEG